ncbi:DUF3108 domain-containing protein [Thalassotalea marina]|uniref:DUF3108 domain-containing protein n=1 Tax=Thalassotalea marina TaxID=1673741 RepID=A0A919ENC4_9GAMM|nr:DUF3108 domain-containing protein [Thalassotalea marina]GHG02156.1 hypothetical protein GCM10017161_33750 [Thalassotalea marina]
MIKTLCYCTGIYLLSIPAFAQEQAVKETTKSIELPSFKAEYTILHKSSPVGTGVRELKYLPDGSAHYSYTTDIEWLIFSDKRHEESFIQLNNGQATPSRYIYTREGTGKDKSNEWRYDIEKNTATDVEKNKSISIKFPKNIQDKLSYHLQNRLDLIANPNQKHFVYPVISTSGSVKNYVYQYDGEEDIMLPYGLVKTIRLKREVLEKKRVTYAWFAPELNFLLVKLYQAKSGNEQFEAQLNKVSFNQATPENN